MTRAFVREALQRLGIKRFLLGVHEAALPADPRDDLGHGAPLSRGGLWLLKLAHDLGFDGLQMGPQGMTSAFNPSPYDGTIFSRNSAALAAEPLVEEGLISRESFERAVAARPADFEWRSTHAEVGALIDEASSRCTPQHESQLSEFISLNQAWLARDCSYAALAASHGEDDWLKWPEADRRYRAADANDVVRKTQVAQWLVHRQHQAFRAAAKKLALLLYGDLQIGASHQDVWSWNELFHPAFRMGAPPSRTNPEGQMWNYGVLDPRRYEDVVIPYLRLRAAKIFSEYDGLRIDHPHGLIDPWVYRAAQPDPMRAVQGGARLFSSPDRSELSAYAIAESRQLDPSQARYADHWVRELNDDQVARYAVLFDELVAAARAHGRGNLDLVAEVLSTLPYPVGRVLERHGLGRFRVTQKVDLANREDVYRSENARPEDWIMAGNHDTPPIWAVAEKWVREGTAEGHARYLAERLRINDSDWIQSTARDPRALAEAKLAELFIGPGQHVTIYFTDLFGMREPYNRPGVIDPANWSLRIPRREAGFDLAAVLKTALASKR